MNVARVPPTRRYHSGEMRTGSVGRDVDALVAAPLLVEEDGDTARATR